MRRSSARASIGNNASSREDHLGCAKSEFFCAFVSTVGRKERGKNNLNGSVEARQAGRLAGRGGRGDVTTLSQLRANMREILEAGNGEKYELVLSGVVQLKAKGSGDHEG